MTIPTTPAQWLACASPSQLLAAVPRRRRSDRKRRLFACACCRLVWDQLDAPSRRAVELAERFADGRADEAERARMRDEHQKVCQPPVSWQSPSWELYHAVREVLANPLGFREYYAWANVAALVGGNQMPCDLLRDVLAPPGRLPRVNPHWARAPEVVRLASSAYDDRDFAALPILADALEEAGCADPAILSHLRHARAEHVRGCWALDLVLGRS